MRIAFTQRIVLPQEWHRSDQSEASLSLDRHLASRIIAAVHSLAGITFKENLPRAQKQLAQLGLVPLCDGGGDDRVSLQVDLAKRIARLVSLGGVRFTLERDELELQVPRSEILFYVAAVHFDVEICLFSTRRRPHVFRPKNEPRCIIGLFWAMDSFSSLSEILPLVCTRTKPTWRSTAENRIILHPQYSVAAFREAPRARAQARQVAVVDDGSAFIRACLLSVRERMKTSIARLMKKPAWREPKKRSRKEQQQECYLDVRDPLLRPSKLPNGILPKAVQIIHGDARQPTESEKGQVQPQKKEDRVRILLEICNAVVFHEVWSNVWQGHSAEPVIAIPFVATTTATNYSGIYETLKAIGNGGQDVLQPVSKQFEDDQTSKALRTCTVPLNRILRQELLPHKDIVMAKIETTQKAITEVTNEVFCLAHMATLAIASGDAYVPEDGPRPAAGFDLKNLFPPHLRPALENVAILNVTPITAKLQENIEKQASGKSQDERFKNTSRACTPSFCRHERPHQQLFCLLHRQLGKV
ncbi:unnamed protein product [Mortierella alpina]